MTDKEKLAMLVGYLKGMIAGWKITVTVPVVELKEFLDSLEDGNAD